MSANKMSQIVKRSFNGDAQQVDPAVHRTMYAMADELDDWRTEMLGEVRGVKRGVYALTSTVVAGILVAIANILLAL